MHLTSETGFVERYNRLLHLLCGELTEAIPYLAASRGNQAGFDRVVVDQTLVFCQLRTQQFDKARELLSVGAAGAGEYAVQYRALLDEQPTPY